MKSKNKIGYYLLYYICIVVGWLPRWYLYGVLRWKIYIIIYWLVGYRRKIVRDNLAKAFPEKNDKERLRIERDFYLQLSEVFVDTIDLVGIKESELRKRITFTDIQEHESVVKGTNWIAALAHYGSWEYFSAYQLFTQSQVAGIYRPLHSEAFDMFFKKMRSRFGLLPVPMKSILRYIATNVKNKERRPIAVGMIADQSQTWGYIECWINFFNITTPFFTGMDHIAKKFSMPIYFMHLQKTGTARYQCRFELLYDGKEPVGEFEITERYAAKLEQMIREEPHLWMWSHRRWKHTPESVERKWKELKNKKAK